MNLDRRGFLTGASALLASAALPQAHAQGSRRIFDSHCHIIDHRFPIVANQGYTPPNFTLDDYLKETKPLGVVAGAVVSGSFQANDQTYLMDLSAEARRRLGRRHADPERLSRRGDRQAQRHRRARGTLQRVPRPHRQRR